MKETTYWIARGILFLGLFPLIIYYLIDVEIAIGWFSGYGLAWSFSWYHSYSYNQKTKRR